MRPPTWYNTGMSSTIFLICALAFSETKTLAVQICLDRRGYSCNTIDGQWGAKSERAAKRFFGDGGQDVKYDPDRI